MRKMCKKGKERKIYKKGIKKMERDRDRYREIEKQKARNRKRRKKRRYAFLN